MGLALCQLKMRLQQLFVLSLTLVGYMNLDSLYGLGIKVRLFPIYDLPMLGSNIKLSTLQMFSPGSEAGVKSHIGWDVVNFDSLYGLGQSSPHNLDLGLSYALYQVHRPHLVSLEINLAAVTEVIGQWIHVKPLVV